MNCALALCYQPASSQPEFSGRPIRWARKQTEVNRLASLSPCSCVVNSLAGRARVQVRVRVRVRVQSGPGPGPPPTGRRRAAVFVQTLFARHRRRATPLNSALWPKTILVGFHYERHSRWDAPDLITLGPVHTLAGKEPARTLGAASCFPSFVPIRRRWWSSFRILSLAPFLASCLPGNYWPARNSSSSSGSGSYTAMGDKNNGATNLTSGYLVRCCRWPAGWMAATTWQVTNELG